MGGPGELSDGQSEAQSTGQMLLEVPQFLPRGWAGCGPTEALEAG